MPIILAPLGWGLIVVGVGLAATSTAALLAYHRDRDFRRRPVDPPITIEDIRREIERIRRGSTTQGERDPERQPQRQPAPRVPRRWPDLDLGTRERENEETVQQRLRRRCHEEDGNCPHCPPAEEGQDYLRSFQGGTVERPYYSSIGAVYQHHVIPWFAYATTVSSFSGEERLHVSISEWEWRRGRTGSWDGLDFIGCTLIETKFGYGKYVNVDALRDDPSEAPEAPGPQGRGDSTLEAAFGTQLDRQVATIGPDGPEHVVGLRWVFSNRNVRSVFTIMTQLRGYFFVTDRHEPMTYGTVLEEMHEVDMRTSDPLSDFGGWGRGAL
ncbi:hypothetical protein AADZ90_000015 [Aestuariibius sp. 2305UL40-4]|uniref:hypothetical protein n=1 Tax=Aestuariibius violaceus TaxID=3234132 RepID=UPI00345E5882